MIKITIKRDELMKSKGKDIKSNEIKTVELSNEQMSDITNAFLEMDVNGGFNESN